LEPARGRCDAALLARGGTGGDPDRPRATPDHRGSLCSSSAATRC